MGIHSSKVKRMHADILCPPATIQPFNSHYNFSSIRAEFQ